MGKFRAVRQLKPRLRTHLAAKPYVVWRASSLEAVITKMGKAWEVLIRFRGSTPVHACGLLWVHHCAHAPGGFHLQLLRCAQDFSKEASAVHKFNGSANNHLSVSSLCPDRKVNFASLLTLTVVQFEPLLSITSTFHRTLLLKTICDLVARNRCGHSLANLPGKVQNARLKWHPQ